MEKERIGVFVSSREEQKIIQDELAGRHFQVILLASSSHLREELRRATLACLILDWETPKASAEETIHLVKKESPACGVLVISSRQEMAVAVKALHAGAYDCLPRPLDPHRLVIGLINLLEREKLARERDDFYWQLERRHRFKNIIGSSKKMQKVFQLVRQVLDSKATILIRGESGTGKELIAEAIHYESPRRQHSLVKVHCAALTETLLESELFGHEKGAFTGALRQKPGRFELADHGTFFLDEIGAVSPSVQVKLLRVLEEGKFERVGGTETIKVDIRIVAATSRNLEEAAEKGAFREDLYYRLNVIPIYLPPLRERKEDIPELVDYFIKRFNKTDNRRIRGVAPEVIELFGHYDWPGNVRELENSIEHAVVLAKGSVIEVTDLPLQLETAGIGKKGQPQTLEESEKNFIGEVLRKNNWNCSLSARILGIDRTTLYQKIKKYGLRK